MPIFVDFKQECQITSDMQIGTMHQVYEGDAKTELFMMRFEEAGIAIGFAPEELLQLMPYMAEFMHKSGRTQQIKDIDITKMRGEHGRSK